MHEELDSLVAFADLEPVAGQDLTPVRAPASHDAPANSEGMDEPRSNLGPEDFPHATGQFWQRNLRLNTGPVVG